MAGFFTYLANRLRRRRYSIFSQGRLYSYGAIYNCRYSNWKHDPTPLVWVQYSNVKYTHGLNLHYLNESDKRWLAQTIFLLKKGAQITDGYTFYKLLKMQRPSIIKTAYRVYFTNMLAGKLVSAGITDMAGMEYSSVDPYIQAINKMIASASAENEMYAPTVRGQPPIQIAYSRTELVERINQAYGARPIKTAKVGGAPWLSGRKY